MNLQGGMVCVVWCNSRTSVLLFSSHTLDLQVPSLNSEGTCQGEVPLVDQRTAQEPLQSYPVLDVSSTATRQGSIVYLSIICIQKGGRVAKRHVDC